MEYRCKKIQTNLLVNGDLTKEEWRQAEGLQLIETVSGNEIAYPTKVKLLWNDEYIYAGFECVEDYVLATMTEYNDKLYEEDVVELFLDADKDRKTYIEIEVNPNNAVLHYGIHNNLTGKLTQYARVDNHIESAVIYNQDKKRLMVEFAIPLTEFVSASNIPPKQGDTWLFNAYRINHKKDKTIEYYAGAKTGEINFHKPECFGTLVFE